MDAATKTGLQLNTAKCEIVMEDFSELPTSSVLNSFIKVEKTEMTLLSSGLRSSKAKHRMQQSVIRLTSWRKPLTDCLFCNPTMLWCCWKTVLQSQNYCTLRNSDCSDNTLLAQFDNTLRAALSAILNVDLNDDQWAQASLPVRNGGLRIRSAQMMAPSVFWASAASTLELQQSILSPSIQTLADKSTETVELSWATLSGASKTFQLEYLLLLLVLKTFKTCAMQHRRSI